MVMSLSRCTEMVPLMSCITVLFLRTWPNEYGSVMTTCCQSTVVGMMWRIRYI